jgi:hypothetical protein
MNPRSLALARGFGSFRYSVLFETTNDLKRMLAGFGLDPEPLLLFEIDKETALAILRRVLWKDLVHGAENMPEADATRLAAEIIDEHSTESSRYYANRRTPVGSEWNPLTNSTFETGVIVQNLDGVHFCIWFEEED